MAGCENFQDGQTLKTYSAFSFHTIRYRFEDGSFAAVIQIPAWCYDCNTVVSAEHIESEEERQKERKQIFDLINGRPNSNPLAEFTHSEIQCDPRDYLATREKHWLDFDSRQQPPTCLECHGANISILDYTTEKPTRIPNGPTLWHTGSSFADVWPVPELTLDINGRPVSEPNSN